MLSCPQCDDRKEEEIQQLQIYRFFLVIRLIKNEGEQTGGCGRRGQAASLFYFTGDFPLLCTDQISRSGIQ